jgi:hypothetical protein
MRNSTGQVGALFLHHGQFLLMASDTPNPFGTSSRTQPPSLSELSKETTENDLWNLDDKLAELPVISPSIRPTVNSSAKIPELPKIREIENSPDEVPVSLSIAKSRFELRNTDHANPLKKALEAPVSQDQRDSLEELLQTPSQPETAARELLNQQSKESLLKPQTSQTPTSSGIKVTRRDIISLTLFSFLLILAGIWVVSHFFGKFTLKSEYLEAPNYPIHGEHTTIAHAKTYWREPIRTGEDRDFARRDVTLIPILEVTIHPEKSNVGALLVTFKDSKGRAVGDSIRRAFAVGRFEASQNPTISFPGTDGFMTEGDFNGYRINSREPWMVEIFEGPSIDAPSKSFKKITSIPVSPLR